jgi:NADH dehydrogenase [ubiquinone] 1 alpha subcomplex assembly factor 2
VTLSLLSNCLGFGPFFLPLLLRCEIIPAGPRLTGAAFLSSDTGQDLHGNTFWEFRDALSPASRMRRIVKYRVPAHHSDVEVSPQWHQWLRHTRAEPPSLEEQARDVLRLQELKVLSRQADERWESKRRVGDTMDHGERRVLEPTMELGGGGGLTKGSRLEEEGGTREREKEVGEVAGLAGTRDAREDPWRRARRNPGEEFQPESWGGRPAEKKRS